MTKPLTTNNPARVTRNYTIANDRLAGMTYREIGKKHGLTHKHIGNILNDEEIKDILETGTKELVSMIPKAIDNYNLFLSSNNEKIQLEASRDMLKTVGIMQTHARTYGDNYYTTIMNKHQNIVITEDMQEFMRWKARQGARVFELPDNTGISTDDDQ